jgi:hypothetical protein
MNWKGYDVVIWNNRGIILEFAWRYRGKPQNTSVRIGNIPV